MIGFFEILNLPIIIAKIQKIKNCNEENINLLNNYKFLLP